MYRIKRTSVPEEIFKRLYSMYDFYDLVTVIGLLQLGIDDDDVWETWKHNNRFNLHTQYCGSFETKDDAFLEALSMAGKDLLTAEKEMELNKDNVPYGKNDIVSLEINNRNKIDVRFGYWDFLNADSLSADYPACVDFVGFPYISYAIEEIA